MTTGRGLFISFEGGEGAGKSTQIKRMEAQLSQMGYDVVRTREPGGTDDAEKIRDLLVQRDGGNWSPISEVMLLYAARTLHTDNLIRPSVETGKIVLSDRFADSTRAYQGFGMGLPLADIETVNDLCLKGFGPDCTFLLDVPVEIGLSRSTKHMSGTANAKEATEDRYEKMHITFHQKLRDGYLTLARQNPARFCVIDATQDIDVITKQIFDHICSLLVKHDIAPMREAQSV